MKILVTGGFGFIGSHLVERLIKEGHDVTVIDDFSTGDASNLKCNVTLFKMGVEDEKCEKIFADFKFDVVVHLAFKALPKLGGKEYGEVDRSNTVGLCNILYFSQKYNVNKLILLSSYQVYGKQNKFPINESSQILAKSEKSGSYIERESREYFCNKYREKGMNVVVLRIGSVYGPRQTKNFISSVIKHAQDYEAEQITIMNQIKDYIYISDVVEAIFKACEKRTSSILNISSSTGLTNSEIQGIINKYIEPDERVFLNYIDGYTKPQYMLDNQKACFELKWSPKYSIDDGIKKTVEWSLKNPDISKNNVVSEKKTLFNRIKTKWFSGNVHKYCENSILFVITTTLMIFLELKFSIKVDLLIIYIVLVNVYYGWWHGIIAILLSTAAYTGIKMGFDNMTMSGVFSNASQALYIAMYFIIGGITGYVVDRMKVEKKELQSDLDSISEELRLTNAMYDKSIEIKNSLQETIESNEDSLGKIFNIISRLDNVIPEQILSEATMIFSKMLKTESVHLYYLDSKKNLRLAAVRGRIKYHKSLMSDDYEFLESVIEEGNTFINREFTDDYPMVCAPIIQDGCTQAVVFLDNLEFKRLTYQFLNTLKVLTYLIANSMSKAAEYESAIQDKKYLSDTFIMKKDWFERLIKEKQMKLSEGDMPIYLIIFMQGIGEKNVELYHRVRQVLRESDHIGEVDGTRFAIMLLNTSKEEASAIEHRLVALGISDTQIEALWRTL